MPVQVVEANARIASKPFRFEKRKRDAYFVLAVYIVAHNFWAKRCAIGVEVE
jgi:hypothetical protein